MIGDRLANATPSLRLKHQQAPLILELMEGGAPMRAEPRVAVARAEHVSVDEHGVAGDAAVELVTSSTANVGENENASLWVLYSLNSSRERMVA